MQGNSSGHFRNTANLSAAKKLAATMPDVRADVVVDVLARIASGEILSPQAAVETARAILTGGECFARR